MLFPRILLLSLAVLLTSPATLATTVLPISLERMSRTAELVFHGRVIANEVKIDALSQSVATYTRFKIIEVVKGTLGDSYTIKQIGGQLPGSNVFHKFHGVPRFRVGQEYVVFLPEPSRLGFASPLGLSQGRFSIFKESGKITVSNGRTINGLLTPRQTSDVLSTTVQQRATGQSLRAVPDQPAKANLDDFLQTVRQLAKE